MKCNSTLLLFRTTTGHARTPTQVVTPSPRGYLLGFILASPLAAACCSVLEGGKVSWPLCSEKQSSVILFIVFFTGGFLPALYFHSGCIFSGSAFNPYIFSFCTFFQAEVFFYSYQTILAWFLSSRNSQQFLFC